MLRSLTLTKSDDRVWGRDDLDALARYWFRMYEVADHPPHAPLESSQSLEVRLSGFTRSAKHAVADEVSRRLPDAKVSEDGPDTLVAQAQPRGGDRLPVSGLGAPALAGAPFDGLMIELRFTIADARATGPGPNVVGATLVIVGELRDGAIRGAAVWCDRPFERNADSWGTAPRWGDLFDKELKGHFRGNTVTRVFANTHFHHQRIGIGARVRGGYRAALKRLVDVPFGKPRLVGLLVRCAAVPLGLGLCLLPMLVGDPRGWWGELLVVFFLASCVLWLGFTVNFVRPEIARLQTDFRTIRANLRARYDQPATYVVLTPSDPCTWQDDPVVRKLTAEALEAGFVHLGDAASVPIQDATTFHRAFLAPDGTTYLTVAFTVAGYSGTERVRIWPATVDTLCQTFDPAGNCFETSDYVHPLALLKREDPTGRWVSVPRGTHPLEVFAAHKEAVCDWLEEGNRTRHRHDSFDDFVKCQNKIARRECTIYRARPYSWRDHLRWYLQLDAKPEPKR
jgi:hypothetical protein